MKAFEKLGMSRTPFNGGDKDIDGYFFKLNEPLTPKEINELLDYVNEFAPFVFKPTYSFGSANLQTMHNNNNPDIVKTMALLTTLKTKTDVPVFSIGKEYGITKIRCMSDVNSINIEPAKEKKAKEPVITEEKKEPAIVEPPAVLEETKVEAPVIEPPAVVEETKVAAPVADKKASVVPKTKRAKKSATKKANKK